MKQFKLEAARWFSWTILAILLAGCQPAPSTTAPLSSEPTISPLPTSTPMLTDTPAPALITLTLWVPDFLATYTAEGDITVFNEQLETFAHQHPDIQVELLIKNATGAGGLYDLLSTAAPVAPQLLPDLIMLNESDLRAAAESHLLQPAPTAGFASTTTFPFATQATRNLTHSYGLPLMVDLEQMVYNPHVSVHIPLSWTAVLSGRYSLLFPAAPPTELADDFLLAAYRGSGGAVVGEDGEPLLERQRLEELYAFLAALHEDGRLRVDLELQAAADCWAAYQQGLGTLSAVSAGEYWNNSARIGSPTWIPTLEGEPFALAHLWSLALVTEEPHRQAAAQKLLAWLAAPQRTAELATEALMLPSNLAAIEMWPLTPDEVTFIERLLLAAETPPAESIDQPVRRALQAGLQMLLEVPATTPEIAAAHALTVLRK